MSSVLIGTNTLDILYERYCDLNVSKPQMLSYGYRVVLKTLAIRQRKGASSYGVARLHSKKPQRIPAGQSRVVEGSVRYRASNVKAQVIVE